MLALARAACIAMALLMGLPTCRRPAEAPATTRCVNQATEERCLMSVARPRGHARSLGEALDALASSEQRAREVAGVSVAVVWHEAPVLVRGYGLADVPGNLPMRADHVFRIGSITKSFTAAAILKLEAQGRLGLDDPLVRHLPDYTASSAITLRHLLTHTSGIADYVDVSGFGTRQAEAKTPAELVAAFAGLPLEFAPGSQWSYSNSGYFLLGLVIEKITGRTYADFLQAEITGPAGLRDTRYCPDEQDYPRAALGYKNDHGRLVPADAAMMKLPFSAGALCSTASDLVQWLAALSHGKIGSPGSFARMSQPVVLTSGKTYPYGLGLAPRELEGHARVGHHGTINGFGCTLHYYPNDDLYLAVLVNTESEAAKEIAEKLAHVVFEQQSPGR
jgi:D-alanyl-D-alanine carboxypeptidase